MTLYDWYKRCSDEAITWLTNKGEECGNDVRLNQMPDPTPPTGKLKGRARTLARREAKSASKASSSSATATTSTATKPAKPYRLSTEEILRQARYLKDSGDTIIMPRRIHRAFKEAIKGRKLHAAKHENENLAVDRKDGHTYFIEVLVEVTKIISTCVRVQKNTPRAAELNPVEPEPATVESIAEDFASFDIDDDDESAIGPNETDEIEAEEAPTTSNVKPSQVVYEPEIDPDEECSFLFWCFQLEGKKIVIYTVQLWESCFKGDMSVLMATLLTEAAMERISLLESTIIEREDVATCINLYMDGNWTPHIMSEYTLQFLEATIRGRRDKNGINCLGFPSCLIPLGSRVNVEYAHPLQLWYENMSQREGGAVGMREQDEFLLQYMMALYFEDMARAYANPDVSPTSLDAISRSLVKVLHGEQPKFSDLTRFAATLLYGIRITEFAISQRLQQLNIPYIELYDMVARLENLQRTLLESSGDVSKEGVSRSKHISSLQQWIMGWNAPLLRYEQLRLLPTSHPWCGKHREFWEAIEEIWRVLHLPAKFQDEFRQMFKDYPDRAGSQEKREEFEKKYIPNPIPDFLRMFNPLCCGKLIMVGQLESTALEIIFANDNPQLFYMCHCYNALRQAGYLNVAWPAIDAVISLHMKALFRGELPTQFQEMFDRFSLATGSPPSLIAAAKRGKIPHWAKGKDYAAQKQKIMSKMSKSEEGRGKFALNPTLQILLDYFDGKVPSMCRSLYLIDKLMQDSTDAHGETAETQPQAASQSSKEKPRKKCKTYSYMDDMDAITFLQALENHVRPELAQLGVKYSQLTLIADKLFEVIELAIRGQSYIGDRGFFFTMELLRQMRDCHRDRKASKEDKDIKASKAVVCGRVLDAYIRAGDEGIPGFSEDQIKGFIEGLNLASLRSTAIEKLDLLGQWS
ncbi:hypothetical protein P280DRAFT_130505 [Massarina eburnea CBS 473.64]|uniref:DUF6604 domain-containing protein n=1 Tax=Massarina eburnea CBS 473.64 TaxID=1395130 RepID=A0A6A6SHE2_9PLEO|nr:hypothetical protein P280DRAFT_130505 [Massarina eburnea CBS 473.64]